MSTQREIITERTDGEPEARGALESPSGLRGQLELCKTALDAFPNLSMVLNGERELVLASQGLAEFLGHGDPRTLIGKRPGEALGCVHALTHDCRCGTTEVCGVCGALQAIQQAGGESISAEPCRLQTRGPEGEKALDLEVWADTLSVGEERFTIVSLVDVGDRERRLALERIFFHDLLNVVGGLQSLVELLRQDSLSDSDRDELLGILGISVERAVDEIESQQTLLKAEQGDLRPGFVMVNTDEFLEGMARRLSRREVAVGKEIHTQSTGSLKFTTDPILLGRILGNMVTNALEALGDGQTVTVSGKAEEDEVALAVHNPGCIPERVQLQIFRRSFSTKGQGRGLGTYGMRLLAERYLGGRVEFQSDLESGTTFTVRLPRRPWLAWGAHGETTTGSSSP